MYYIYICIYMYCILFYLYKHFNLLRNLVYSSFHSRILYEDLIED